MFVIRYFVLFKVLFCHLKLVSGYMKTKHYFYNGIAQKVKYLRKNQSMSQEGLSERVRILD